MIIGYLAVCFLCWYNCGCRCHYHCHFYCYCHVAFCNSVYTSVDCWYERCDVVSIILLITWPVIYLYISLTATASPLLLLLLLLLLLNDYIDEKRNKIFGYSVVLFSASEFGMQIVIRVDIIINYCKIFLIGLGYEGYSHLPTADYASRTLLQMFFITGIFFSPFLIPFLPFLMILGAVTIIAKIVLMYLSYHTIKNFGQVCY